MFFKTLFSIIFVILLSGNLYPSSNSSSASSLDSKHKAELQDPGIDLQGNGSANIGMVNAINALNQENAALKDALTELKKKVDPTKEGKEKAYHDELAQAQRKFLKDSSDVTRWGSDDAKRARDAALIDINRTIFEASLPQSFHINSGSNYALRERSYRIEAGVRDEDLAFLRQQIEYKAQLDLHAKNAIYNNTPFSARWKHAATDGFFGGIEHGIGAGVGQAIGHYILRSVDWFWDGVYYRLQSNREHRNAMIAQAALEESMLMQRGYLHRNSEDLERTARTTQNINSLFKGRIEGLEKEKADVKKLLAIVKPIEKDLGLQEALIESHKTKLDVLETIAGESKAADELILHAQEQTLRVPEILNKEKILNAEISSLQEQLKASIQQSLILKEKDQKSIDAHLAALAQAEANQRELAELIGKAESRQAQVNQVLTREQENQALQETTKKCIDGREAELNALCKEKKQLEEIAVPTETEKATLNQLLNQEKELLEGMQTFREMLTLSLKNDADLKIEKQQLQAEKIDVESMQSKLSEQCKIAQDIQREIGTLQQALADKDIQIQTSKDHVASKSADLRLLKKESQTIESLKTQAGDAKLKRVELDKQQAELRAQCASLDADIKSISAKLDTQIEAFDEDLKDSVILTNLKNMLEKIEEINQAIRDARKMLQSIDNPKEQEAFKAQIKGLVDARKFLKIQTRVCTEMGEPQRYMEALKDKVSVEIFNIFLTQNNLMIAQEIAQTKDTFKTQFKKIMQRLDHHNNQHLKFNEIDEEVLDANIDSLKPKDAQ